MLNNFRNEMRSRREGMASLENQLDLIGRHLKDLNERQIRAENSLREISSRISKVQTLPISEHEVLTKIFTDLKMYLNPEDMAVAAHIALDGIWEKEITRAWLAVLKTEDVVLDIGANFGYYGLLAGQFTSKKKAKIIMFEANHKLVPYINKSVSINWLNEQTTVENLAVSNKSGTISLNVLQDYIGSSSVQSMEELESYMHEKMQLKVNEIQKVKSTSIDEYCDEHEIDQVDLIKMDIEGHEDFAYQGMASTVKRSKGITLFVEFTKDAYKDPKAFYGQMLDDFGYVYVIDANGKLVKPKSSDYAFVIGGADDWVMPVFSKNPELDKSQNVSF